jgi:hypothetical protein
VNIPRESITGSPDAPQANRTDELNPVVVELLSSMHRLLKVARMYDKNNQALAGSAGAVIAATAEYCASQTSPFADLMFANETVFVNGRMLQMPREVYARVMELGAMLDKCDISNVNVSRDATVDDLVNFVHTLGTALRDPAIKPELVKPSFGGVRARRIKWRANIEGDTESSCVSRTVRTYSAAVVLLRRFHASIAEGKRTMPLAIRRVAQRIVTHAEQEAPLLVALAAARTRGVDEAAVSVSAALVAVLMARHLTTDRGVLTDLVLAALLHDVGRRRLVSLRGTDATRSADSPLSEDEQDRLAASGTVGLVGLGGVGELAAPGTVISFEARWFDRTSRLGAIYGGRRPATVLARILSLARSFSELMVPSTYGSDMRPEDAIEFLMARTTDDTQRVYVRLLTAGLGVFPPGTSVELNTGEIGVVTRVPDQAVDFGRPPIRVMYDAAGNVLDLPLDIDLSEPAADGPRRFIRAALDTDAQQTQAMRAFVLSLTRPKTSKRQAPPPMIEDTGRRPVEPPRATSEDATQARKHEAIEPTQARKHEAVEPTQARKHDTAEPTQARKHDTAEPTQARKHDTAEPTQARKHEAVDPTLPTGTKPATEPGRPLPGDIPRSFGRPRSNPGPLPRGDDADDVSYPRIEQLGSAPVSQPRTPAPVSVGDAARAMGRPRSNPGPLARGDDPVPSRPRTDPRADGAPLSRPRTDPRADPRSDPSPTSSSRSGSEGDIVRPFGRARTNPGPSEPTSSSRVGRPITDPQSFRPVEIVNAPPASRARTAPPIDRSENPSPLSRPRTAPPIDRSDPAPAARPRTVPSALDRSDNPAPSPLTRPRTAPPIDRGDNPPQQPLQRPRTGAPIDRGDNPPQQPLQRPRTGAPIDRGDHSPPLLQRPRTAPPIDRGDVAQPAPPKPVAASNNAPTVARSWKDFSAELEATAERDPAPAPPVKPAPAATVNNAPTVARSWADFEADEPVPPTLDAEKAEAARRPTRELKANPVNSAPTVARSWGDFHADGEEPPDEPAAGKPGKPGTVPKTTVRVDPRVLEDLAKDPKKTK